MDAFAATRIVVGTAFLAFAAASDFRSRTVRNPVWIGLGTVGLGLAAVEAALQGSLPERLVLLGATAALFASIFVGEPLFDREGFHLRPLRLALLAAVPTGIAASAWLAAGTTGAARTAYLETLTAPAIILVYLGLYRTRVLFGGADAKALIALTLLVPTYPDAAPFPWLAPDPRVAPALRLVFPFSLVAWVDAAVLFLAVPLAYAILNAARGDFAFPQAFLGTRADLSSLPAHAWLMEKIDRKGEHVLVLFPRRGGDRAAEVEALRAAGIRRAWVQPKVPFMVPLLGGFLLASFLGNVLLAFLPR